MTIVHAQAVRVVGRRASQYQVQLGVSTLPQVLEGCGGLVNILPRYNRDACWIEPLCSPAFVTHEACADDRNSPIAITFENTTVLQNYDRPTVSCTASQYPTPDLRKQVKRARTV